MNERGTQSFFFRWPQLVALFFIVLAIALIAYQFKSGRVSLSPEYNSKSSLNNVISVPGSPLLSPPKSALACPSTQTIRGNGDHSILVGPIFTCSPGQDITQCSSDCNDAAKEGDTAHNALRQVSSSAVGDCINQVDATTCTLPCVKQVTPQTSCLSTLNSGCIGQISSPAGGPMTCNVYCSATASGAYTVACVKLGTAPPPTPDSTSN